MGGTRCFGTGTEREGMEQKLVLCDTDVLVEYFRKNVDVIQLIDGIGSENIFASVITKIELLQWANTKEKLRQINKRIEKFAFIEIELATSQIFAEIFEKYFLEYGCKIPDTLIAATAINYDIELFTLNKKHYHFYKGLRLFKHQLKPLKGKSNWLN